MKSPVIQKTLNILAVLSMALTSGGISSPQAAYAKEAGPGENIESSVITTQSMDSLTETDVQIAGDGETANLSIYPGAGLYASDWTGTDDNNRLGILNSLIMQGILDSFKVDYLENLNDMQFPALLVDVYQDSPSSYPREFVELNNKLFFVANSEEGNVIWVYDPNMQIDETNPNIAVDLFTSYGPGFYPSPENLIAFGGKLYFNFDSTGHGVKLWIFDPEIETSVDNPKEIEVYEEGADNEYYNPVGNRLFNNLIYFTNSECGYNAKHSIWVFDPSQPNVIGSNPQIATSMFSDNCWSPIGKMEYLNNKIYFNFRHGLYGSELWEYNPEEISKNNVNPKMPFEIRPGFDDSYVSNLKVVGSNLFFQADDGVYGRELWIYDPFSEISNENPIMVADINPESNDGFLGSISEIDGKLLFVASDGVHGDEYWFFDPNQLVSETNPKMIMDINEGEGSGAGYLAVEIGGRVFFRANDGISGDELWVYNLAQPDSESNPKLFMDIFPGLPDSIPGNFYDFNGTLYFNASDGDVGAELWNYKPAQCYILSLSSEGSGSNPVAVPLKSENCIFEGEYTEGESIELTAYPDSGWEVSAWTGTSNNSSTETTNTVTMPASAHAASVTYGIEIASSPPYTDFDGDGISDPAKFYASNGTVWWLKSSSGTWESAWLGPETFDYVPRSDFDGDGKSDPGKFNSVEGTIWYIKSSDSAWEGQYLGVDSYTYHEGADFDGDGKTDPTKLIPNGAIWYIKSSTDTWEGFWLGPEAFEYVTGDFDGDGKNDPAKFIANPGVLWYWESSMSGWVGIFLGSDAYEYVSGSDFDGDGKDDPTKFYAATNTVWWLKSSTGLWDAAWMGPGSFDFVGGNDFDGDGKTDPAKYDPVTGILSWLKSSSGTWDSADMGTDVYEIVN